MRVFSLLIIVSVSSAALVEWTPNKSFNLPINFRDHKLPCSKQAVVFPQHVSEAIKIEAEISVKEFILPIDGELLLEDAIISFGADGQDNCTDNGNSYYIPKATSYWGDPDVWKSSRFNKATPDAERMPCYYDEVVFPSNSEFTIFLPKKIQYVRKLTVDGVSQNSLSFFNLPYKNLMETKRSQQFLMNNMYGTGLLIVDRQCTKPKGCPCQPNPLEMDCTLKFCPQPKCLDPVQPIGHCCKICGGFLIVDNETQFDMIDFEENVAEVVYSYGKESLVYHIGILPDYRVQLVIVEIGEYVGTSAEAVHEMEYRSNSKGVESLAHISGVPSSKAGLGGKIAFSMFFVVVTIMGAVYVYYYKTPRLPEFPYPTIGRNARTVLSRFNRRSESVVSLTSRRDSTGTIGSSFGTAFRNPMYDSKRGRVQVVESVEEE